MAAAASPKKRKADDGEAKNPKTLHLGLDDIMDHWVEEYEEGRAGWQETADAAAMAIEEFWKTKEAGDYTSPSDELITLLLTVTGTQVPRRYSVTIHPSSTWLYDFIVATEGAHYEKKIKIAVPDALKIRGKDAQIWLDALGLMAKQHPRGAASKMPGTVVAITEHQHSVVEGKNVSSHPMAASSAAAADQLPAASPVPGPFTISALPSGLLSTIMGFFPMRTGLCLLTRVSKRWSITRPQFQSISHLSHCSTYKGDLIMARLLDTCLPNHVHRLAHFHHDGVSSAGLLRTINALTNLRALEIHHSPNVTPPLLVAISHLEDLETLHITVPHGHARHHLDHAPPLSPPRPSIAPLAKLRNLTALDIHGEELEDHAGLALLSPTLTNLNLSNWRHLSGSDGYLAAFPNLQTLNLSGCHAFDSAGIQSLLGAQTLCELRLRNCTKIVDADLEALSSSLPSLERLDVGYNYNITGKGVAHLLALPNLTRLVLNHSSKVSIDELPAGTGKHLAHLELNSTLITDADVGHLSHLPALQHLEIKYCLGLTQASLESLVGGCDDGRQRLTFLDLGGCDEWVDDACLAVIGVGLTHLRQLDLADCDLITDVGVSYLAKGLAHLEELDMSFCEVDIDPTDGDGRPLFRPQTNVHACN